MILRKYISSDYTALAELFYNTVHTVNAKDYTIEQLNAWATGTIDFEKWNQSFLEHYTLVAIENDVIIGFGDIDNRGYKVVKEQQVKRQGIYLTNFVMEKER